MKTLTYIPDKDKLVLKYRPLPKRPRKKFRRFKIWWDGNGYIYGMEISSFTEELDEFQRQRGWIELGGIWRGIKIEEEDIKEARQELLKKIEARWKK